MRAATELVHFLKVLAKYSLLNIVLISSHVALSYVLFLHMSIFKQKFEIHTLCGSRQFMETAISSGSL